MKRRTLLLLVMISLITVSQAQRNSKKQQPVTGYALTAVEKGGRHLHIQGLADGDADAVDAVVSGEGDKLHLWVHAD